jgi:hypothetical protein
MCEYYYSDLLELSRTCSNTSKNLVDFPKTKFPIWGLYARKLAEKAALFVEYTRMMGLRMNAGKTQLLFSSRASNVADTTVEVDGSVICRCACSKMCDQLH